MEDSPIKQKMPCSFGGVFGYSKTVTRLPEGKAGILPLRLLVRQGKQKNICSGVCTSAIFLLLLLLSSERAKDKQKQNTLKKKKMFLLLLCPAEGLVLRVCVCQQCGYLYIIPIITDSFGFRCGCIVWLLL